jgi:hypothetical protein
MSIRRFTLAMTLLVVAAAVAFVAAIAAAGEGGYHTGDPWHNYWVDWHRNNCWPEPFVEPDAASVCAAFRADIIKGWEQQNLLGDPHFEPNGYKLSASGLIKLRWILTPFVERTASDEITARRLAATQQAAMDLEPGMPVNVAVSDMRMFTTPSDYVTGVHAWFGNFMKTIPDPQIQAFQNSSTQGTSSGP